MPANVGALAKKAEADAELACRAYTKEFAEGDSVVQRGVISHYAAATFAGAHSLSHWLDRIEAMSRADLERGVITAFYQPTLQVIGDAHLPLPGIAQPPPQ
ncbi:MAG: hypothetical protein R3E79_59040 [Caldilineaceae bacterium]